MPAVAVAAAADDDNDHDDAISYRANMLQILLLPLELTPVSIIISINGVFEVRPFTD